MTPETPTALTSNQAEHLAAAFSLFNRASAELTDAYTSLQSQVARLTAELAAANGELRRQYQAKARLSERLGLLLDALPAGVVVLDCDGTVEQCNPAAEAILGTRVEGRGWREAASSMQATQNSGEFRCGASGDEKHVVLVETEIDSAGGRIVLLHDVSAARRMQRDAERNQRLTAMGEMAAALAHQLRTPLAAALLYTGNLGRPELAAEERARLVDKVIARLKHLERLIQDMLVFARGEAAGREWFDAGALIGDIVHVVEPLARDKQVGFAVDDRSAGARIHGDRKAVAGAFINLLENALQACAAGGRIALTAAADDGEIVFRVCDDGRGIDPATQGRLFEPFFTTRPAGTGLGLAIARGVVRAHGGSIDLAAAQVGTEFLVRLPCRRT